MRNTLLITGLLVSLWSHGQELVINDHEYLITDCQPHLRVSYNLINIEVSDTGYIISGGIKICEDTGVPLYENWDCAQKHFVFQLDSGLNDVVFTYEIQINCYVPYAAALCNICIIKDDPNYTCVGACAGGCCVNSPDHLIYIQPYDGDMCEIYDTIFVYDTIPVMDTTWVNDTIWIKDTLEIQDTIPVYLVYESTTGVDPEQFEIRITDNEIRLNFNPAEVRIYDLAGILIKTSSESIIDLTRIDTGIYILKIKLQNGEGFETKFLH